MKTVVSPPAFLAEVEGLLLYYNNNWLNSHGRFGGLLSYKCSIAMKKHQDHGDSYKRSHLNAYSFRGLVHCHHGG